MELIDGELRRVVERDQRAAVAHEVAQRRRARLAESARVLARHRARREAVHQRARGGVGDQDGVEAFAQMAGLHVAVAQRDRREAVLFENPARPAFVDRSATRGGKSPSRGFFIADGVGRCFRRGRDQVDSVLARQFARRASASSPAITTSPFEKLTCAPAASAWLSTLKLALELRLSVKTRTGALHARPRAIGDGIDLL